VLVLLHFHKQDIHLHCFVDRTHIAVAVWKRFSSIAAMLRSKDSMEQVWTTIILCLKEN